MSKGNLGLLARFGSGVLVHIAEFVGLLDVKLSLAVWSEIKLDAPCRRCGTTYMEISGSVWEAMTSHHYHNGITEDKCDIERDDRPCTYFDAKLCDYCSKKYSVSEFLQFVHEIYDDRIVSSEMCDCALHPHGCPFGDKQRNVMQYSYGLDDFLNRIEKFNKLAEDCDCTMRQVHHLYFVPSVYELYLLQLDQYRLERFEYFQKLAQYEFEAEDSRLRPQPFDQPIPLCSHCGENVLFNMSRDTTCCYPWNIKHPLCGFCSRIYYNMGPPKMDLLSNPM